MNPYAIPSLVVGGLNLALCVYILYKNPRSSLSRQFALVMVPLIIWPICEFHLRSTTTPELAAILARICWAVVAFIPIALLNFTHTFPKATPSRRGQYWIVLLFFVAFSFSLVILRTDYVISGATLRYWGFDTERGSGFGIFAAYLCLLFIYAVMMMLRKARKLSCPEKTSAEYITIGISIPIITGSLTQVILPLYGIDILPIASLSTLALSIFIGAETMRYRSMIKIPSVRSDTILNTLSDAVFVVNGEGKIISVNGTMAKLLEYAEMELLHKPLDTIVAEDQRIYMTTGWMWDENGVRDRSLVWRTKSGKDIPVTLTTSPLKDGNGALKGFVGVARDTRREVTLEQMFRSSMGQLKESQEKYRTLVEKSLDGICIIQDNKVKFANQRVQEMLGYSLEELKQMDFLEQVAPESQELVKDKVLGTLRGEKPPEEFEFKAVRKDGKIIDVEILTTLIEYQGKSAIQGCARDITENKKLREKLAALYRLGSELSLSLNLDQICDRTLEIVAEVLDFDNCALLLLNEETNELYIKAQMGYPMKVENLTISLAGDKGITAAVAKVGKPIYVPDVTADERYVEGLPEAKSEIAVPLAAKNRVIGVLNVESKEADAFNEQDVQLLGTLGYHASIAIQTSHLFEKVTEKALELSTVIEIAKALTSSIDIEVLKPTVMEELKKSIPYDLGVLYLYDKKEGRLVIAAQIGLSEDETLERELTAMERHPGNIFTTKKPLLVKNVDDDPRVSYLETMNKPASLLYVPVTFHDKALGVIGLVSFEKDHFDERHLRLTTAIASEVAIAIQNAHLVKDLATAKVDLQKLNEDLERKVVERTKALEETQEELLRKEKLATLGQLAGSVAHELRNPLAVIRNSLYCTNQRLTHVDQKVTRHLEIIDQQILRADGIIEDLLDYSKTKIAKKKEIVLNRFVTTVLNNLLIPSNIRVTTRFSDDLPSIKLDSEQIGRVIANLVKNGVEAMPEGGELVLESRMCDGHPTLKIADTGIGIPEKDLRRIFQPLFTTKARGIGLGLALSDSLVKANGIEIKAESRVDKGSSFTLIFGDKSLSTSKRGGNDERKTEDSDRR